MRRRRQTGTSAGLHPAVPVHGAQPTSNQSGGTAGLAVAVAHPQMSRLLDLLPMAVVLAGPDGNVSVSNRQGRQLLVPRPSTVAVGRTVRRLLHEVRASGDCSEVVELHDPPVRRYRVTARAVEQGWVMAVVEDLSDQARVEALRRDFVANIGHELKTPVGALSLLAETLAGEACSPDADTAAVSSLAGRLVAEVTRLDHTIDDLLTLSRIETAEGMEHEPVDLFDVAREAVARLRSAAEQAGVHLRMSAAVESSAVVRGDRRQLVSALVNLLDNAVKYSDEDSVVTVVVEQDHLGIRLVVSDQGVGIPAADLGRVFERFYRVDRARSRSRGGTGLGLAIVRHVMTNHDGRVELDSVEGQGTTFTLWFPNGMDPEEPEETP